MKKLFFLLIFSISVFFAVYAQADGDDKGIIEGDFSEGFGSFDDFPGAADEDQTGSDEIAAAAIELAGTAGAGTRFFIKQGVDAGSLDSVFLSGIPYCDLSVSFRGNDADFYSNFEINSKNLANTPADILDEVWIKVYLGFMNIQAGYVKTTWGKGDSLHVLDLLNAVDYSDFVNSIGLDSKIASTMLKIDFPLGADSLLELAWLPFRTSDRIPLTGEWVPDEISAAMSTAHDLLFYGPGGNNGLYSSTYAVISGGIYTSVYNQVLAATSGNTVLAAAAAAAASTSQNVADMAAAQAEEQIQDRLDTLFNQDYRYSLNDAQIGLRYTGTAGGFDFGLEYFWGMEKKPILPDLSSIISLEQLESLDLEYPRIHVFGFDTAFVLAGFSFRTEAAYTLMQDRNFIDYISWSAGFDRSIPVSSLNINIQAMGVYYLEERENRYTSLAAVQISDSWANDRIRPLIAAAYGFENSDIMAGAGLDWDLAADFTMSLGYRLFYGDAGSQFGQFSDNDYAEIKFSYMF